MKKTTAVEVEAMVNSLLLSSVSIVSHLCIETAPEACMQWKLLSSKNNWTGLIQCLLF
jgi:hypothetical protein